MYKLCKDRVEEVYFVCTLFLCKNEVVRYCTDVSLATEKRNAVCKLRTVEGTTWTGLAVCVAFLTFEGATTVMMRDLGCYAVSSVKLVKCN